jgi:hypothetical protein
MTVEQEVQLVLDHLQENGLILRQHFTRADDSVAAGATS